MLVYATLPKVTVTKKGIEKNKEIYVLSLASDRHGESHHRPPVTGATNETLGNVTSGIEAAMKFCAVAVSNVFHDIRPGQPVSLSGDGIVVYPPLDPKGMIALHFVVVESDKGKRNVGKILSGIFGNSEVKNLLKEVSQITKLSANIPGTLLTSLFGAVAHVVPEVLKANKDDVLFAHNHSGAVRRTARNLRLETTA